ncbi:ribosome biogenesis GTP-binding protein YihA/YsxC [Alphaproteobacteria bacterium]|nr:ribosome biogenesis GTP-binding protein YihA/YsxC [Alphaproteobacteria bacterium]
MNGGKRSLNLFFSKNNFIGSFNAIDIIPNNNMPECCFIGRSNVGKSSIINAVTRSKKLAKTSKTPGRTQSINLFKINNIINIVDMPGYGYAKVSKIKRKELSNLIEAYIVSRANLSQVFILIDCKVGIKNIDIDFFDSIGTTDKKFSIILTKSDKCASNFIVKQEKSIVSLMQNYKNNFLKIYSTSSVKNMGIIDIQKAIYNLSTHHEI